MRFLRVALLLFAIFCLVGLPACSLFKSKPKSETKQVVPVPETGLIAKGEEEVRTKYGVPTIICKTTDGHILWVYQPKMKIMPNDKGTLYVEFEEGKVVKIFKKQ